MIDIRTVNDILLLRESEEVEFKEGIGRDGRGKLPDNFWDSYSAMANTDGGYIFLGIAEKKNQFHFAGLPSTESLRKNIVDIANNANKVSVNLLTNDSFRDLCFDGNHVLCVHIPRAKRQQRPVYLNNNPIYSFRRLHEADQRLTSEEVRRYLAEQLGDTRDAEALPGFNLGDLSTETLRAYRQLYANLQPEHPWNELDDPLFLTQIGAAQRNRETGSFCLTVAGLLMFGTHPAIQEKFPYYMLDYQERDPASGQTRWVDRLTLDGSWSGNLFDFHRRVYIKLIAGLKIPFRLEGDKRIDEGPVHVALREAMINTLVHADYSDRASVLVVKRPDMFGFRNPGLMRVSWEVAMRGGESDCRNRRLHQMFRYIGLGEQAGSGIPKILDGWKKTHWRPPSLYEKIEPYNQTLMELRMIDLFPPGTVEHLQNFFDGKGIDYAQLDHNSQVALAVALSEGMVNHERLKQLTDCHSADLSQTLHLLVSSGVLHKTGHNRNAVYFLAGFASPLEPNDVFGPELDTNCTNSDTDCTNSDTTHLSENTTHLNSDTTHLSENTTHLNSSSTHLNSSSTHLNSSSTHLDSSSTHLNSSSTHLNSSSTHLNSSSTHLGEKSVKMIERNSEGCVVSSRLKYPVVDALDKLSDVLRTQLEHLAQGARGKKKIPQPEMEQILISCCSQRYITLAAFAQLLNRSEKTLRNSYFSRMVREKKLLLAFPAKPNDPRQAYIATESILREE